MPYPANGLHVQLTLNNLERRVLLIEGSAVPFEQDVLRSSFEMEALRLTAFCQVRALKESGKVNFILTEFRNRIVAARTSR